MHDKERSLIDAFVAGKMSRRELMSGAAKLGLAAGIGNTLLSRSVTKAMAADFDWQAHKGKTINLLLNKHPYADAMIADIDAFKSLTGMDVKYDVFPEDVYFDKVTAALSSKSSQYDCFMTGAYQTWQYGPAGWLVDLNEFIDSPKTAPTWDKADMIPTILASDSWSGKPGDPLGGPGAKQWALPWAFELNSVSYNKRMFDANKIDLPADLPALMEAAAKIQKDTDAYGIAVRGSRSWATIHPGFLSGYTSYGGKDLVVENGHLKAAMNSPQAKEFTKLWVKMIQDSGPKNWATYTWYQVGNDLGAGATGMIFDADILGYFQNTGDTKEKGNIGFHAFAAKPGATEPTPNVWIWSLAMSSASQQKDAAWYWLQWATSKEHDLFGGVKMQFVDPARQSVWDDAGFKAKMASSVGYLEQFQKSAPGSKIYFTPQPLFFNVTTDWAAALQQMVANQVPVDEGLDKLVDSINKQMEQAGL